MRKTRLIDLTGLRFGRWLVIGLGSPAAQKPNSPRWLCECECGSSRTVNGGNLRDGTSMSCGCLQNGRYRSRSRSHHGDKKICRTCLVAKQRDEFHPKPNGISMECRKCISKRQKTRRLAYRDKQEEERRKKTIVRESSKRWKSKNPESVANQWRARRARKRTAAGTHSASDVADIKRLQRNRCAYCRGFLRKEYTHVDHIIALSCGGSNDRRNLQITCSSCNTSKKAKHPIEYARSIGMLI